MIKINKIAISCLLIGALGRASFSKDSMTAQKAEEARIEARKAAIKASKEAGLPIIQDTQISINIASKKDKFYGGEQVPIDVKLNNNGDSQTMLGMYPLEIFYDIEVVGPHKGDLLKLPSVSFRNYSGSLVSFNIGKTRLFSGSVIVSNLFDMSLAGSYQVKVSKRFRLESNKKPVMISSNVLNIEVTSDVPLSEWHFNQMN